MSGFRRPQPLTKPRRGRDRRRRAVTAAGSVPAGVAAAANPIPVGVSASPAAAVTDYRMVEGQGLHALDFAVGPFGVLELANLEWVSHNGRPVLKFADDRTGKAVFPKSGGLDLNYLRLLRA
jgi:hypothetical protein